MGIESFFGTKLDDYCFQSIGPSYQAADDAEDEEHDRDNYLFEIDPSRAQGIPRSPESSINFGGTQEPTDFGGAQETSTVKSYKYERVESSTIPKSSTDCDVEEPRGTFGATSAKSLQVAKSPHRLPPQIHSLPARREQEAVVVNPRIDQTTDIIFHSSADHSTGNDVLSYSRVDHSIRNDDVLLHSIEASHFVEEPHSLTEPRISRLSTVPIQSVEVVPNVSVQTGNEEFRAANVTDGR